MDNPRLDDTSCGTISIGGDLTVRRLGYGAMRLTGEGIWGAPADPDGARDLLRRAVDLGINFIDTADAYGPDVNETTIAEALHPYPADLVIATKGGLIRQGPGQWSPVGRPDHLRAACDGSLARLRLDTIDLYQLHRPDPDVPFEESVGALAELRAEGKIRHVGLSNVDVDQLAAAQAIVPIASVQNRYNLVDRDSEAVLRACENAGIAFIPWFPLASGDFTKATAALTQVGEAHGVGHNAAGLAWLLHRSPMMLPIPGTSSIAHLEENLAAAFVTLTEPETERLDAFSPMLSARLGKLSGGIKPETRARIAKRAPIFKRWWNKLRT